MSILSGAFINVYTVNDMNDRLYYTAPAKEWHNALPLGNGRIGAMIWGIPLDEIVSLNEDSIWSGKYRDRNNPKALANLERIRELIRTGQTDEANALCETAFYGCAEQQRHYMPLGDMHIHTELEGEPEGYSHTLSLSSGVDEVSFTAGDVTVRRTSFVSYPDGVMVMRLQADSRTGGRVRYSVTIDGRDDNYDSIRGVGRETLLFTVTDGIPYTCAVTAVGGQSAAVGVSGNILEAETDFGEDVILIIGVQTGYRAMDHSEAVLDDTGRALRMGYARLYERHLQDHAALYDRCRLSLDASDSGIPTNERLERLRRGESDRGLAELYFNYSRYLMIAGSRPGTLPLNLQGIWNHDMWPAWGCKYTININTEMNYWGAEMQNLSECHLPLLCHIERMREHGRVTAREMYGCRGMVCHHNTDIWGDTAPQDRWLPATAWVMGLAWLCLHIYEHYLFTRDKDFLREKIDTMAEAAEFFLDFLIENEEGYLVTSPSLSPENTYITPEGRKGVLCEGSTMDIQILRSLFTAVLESFDAVGGVDEQTISQIRQAREKLPPLRVGKYGQICEWTYDYDEAEPGHRHISQLFGLYPAASITPDTPQLYEAARATIERRLSHGGGHTGWSRAWIINMWARLHDGEKVGENIKALLANSTADSMLDMHPPFQIDGNFGGGAGICEALIQSVNGVVELLPALVPDWKKGSLAGVRARGGFELSFEWEDGRVIHAEVKSLAGETMKLRSETAIAVNGKVCESKNGICEFQTQANRVYDIHFGHEAEDC